MAFRHNLWSANRKSHMRHIGHGGNIVYPQYACAARHGQSHGCGSAEKALAGCRFAKQLADE